jgi:hypothetical protein
MATVETALFDSGRPILVVPSSAPGPATLTTQACPSSWPSELPSLRPFPSPSGPPSYQQSATVCSPM